MSRNNKKLNEAKERFLDEFAPRSAGLLSQEAHTYLVNKVSKMWEMADERAIHFADIAKLLELPEDIRDDFEIAHETIRGVTDIIGCKLKVDELDIDVGDSIVSNVRKMHGDEEPRVIEEVTARFHLKCKDEVLDPRHVSLA